MVASDPPPQFRLPEPVARILRPAAQRHQQLMEIGFQRPQPGVASRCATLASASGASPAPRRHRSRSPPGRRFRASDHGWRRRARRHRRLAARRRPKRLPFVEISSRPGAEALGDQPRPVDPRDLRGEIGDGRQRADLGLRDPRGGLQLRQARGAQRMRRASPGPPTDPRR